MSRCGFIIQRNGCRPEGRRYIFVEQHELCDEQRIAQIRQVVVETLCRMDRAQRTEILLGVLANKHFSSTGFSLCSDGLCKRRRPKTEQAEACSTQSNDWRVMREPGRMPKPLPPRGTPLGKTPLPLEARGAGPAAPPPATAIGGATGGDTAARGQGRCGRLVAHT